jgi:protein-S-isoprenylcysteine O-methyltransferase Ste14
MENATPLRAARGCSVFIALDASDPPPTRDSAGVVAPPPLIFLGGLAIGFGLEALLPGSSVPDAVQWTLGGLLLVAGLTLLVSFNSLFNRHDTAVEPWKPTTAIVTTGPYRFTRNPAYLGMALVYMGIALMASALWVLLPLPVVLAVMNNGVIKREERYLERKFGTEYLDYKSRARRWV